MNHIRNDTPDHHIQLVMQDNIGIGRVFRFQLPLLVNAFQTFYGEFAIQGTNNNLIRLFFYEGPCQISWLLNYTGPIGIKEGNDLHLIDHWCYFGTAKNEAEVQDLLGSSRPAFDRDTYTILNKALKKAKCLIHFRS